MLSISKSVCRVLMVTVALGATLQAGLLRAADGGPVELSQGNDTVTVKIGDEEFTTYRYAASQPKPYFWPVRSPKGTVVTRELENVKDHPHHKGIWLSIDEVNGLKFWAEQAKIQTKSVTIDVPSGNPAKLTVANDWLGTDNKPVLVETTQISIWSDRLITYDVTFTAAVDVTFGDTKEGMFGIRLADPLREKVGGSVVNAEGKLATKECWGQESKWVDYFGTVSGDTCGVTLFDHPKNFRKSRYHVRDYGLFTISPFGQHDYTNGQLPEDPYKLPQGQKVQFTYGLYVHEGNTEAGKVAAEYEKFLRATK